MGLFMGDLIAEVLSVEEFNILDEGGEIKCPYSRCGGLVRKVPEDNPELFTEFDFEASQEYVCSKNRYHCWGPSH
jgi:hypothetical protein